MKNTNHSKIRVLIINDDNVDYRQPLLHRFYNFLCDTDFDKFDYHRLNNYKCLSEISISRLNEYDVIWQGFRGAPLYKIATELNASDIAVIMESGDPVLFGNQLYTKNIKDVEIASIITRTLHGNDELYGYKRFQDHLRYADVIFIPHCIGYIDKTELKPIQDRTYDFCFIQKLGTYKTHKYKNELHHILSNAINNELKGKVAYINETFSDEYNRILNDSKICVCSGCYYKDFVKMRYFEAAGAGAVVLGEDTDRLRNIFIPGHSMIESPYGQVEAVVDILNDYLIDDDRLQEIADMAVEKVNEKANLGIVSKSFNKQLHHSLFYHMNDANKGSLIG